MNQHIDKIKNHLRENKKVYICTAVGVAVGAVGVLVLKNQPRTTQIVNTISPVFNNNNSSNVNFGGYAHKIIKNNNTEEIWETVKDASQAIGVSSSKMSRHLNGHTENIGGETFSIIGVGTSG